MNNYPEYAEVNGRRYKINTDFRYAIRCNQIALDDSIGDTERALGLLVTLFGEKGLDYPEDYEKLITVAKKYLCCGEEPISGEKQDMDFIQDEKYIKSSFKYDYKYDPYKQKYIHWYEFYNDLSNLSNSEMGDCCVLNRIRNIRNFDTSKIKDQEEKKKIEKAKKMVALHKVSEPKREFTEEEIRNMEEYERLMSRKE